MTIDPRDFVDNDKKFPTDMAGDANKVLVVNQAEDGYIHAPNITTTDITGQIIMWPLDTPPVGYLMCDGATYNHDDYPALGALFGSSAGGTFQVPNINFVKNSKGVNTLTEEAESVGTHGHVADAVAAHDHSITVNSVSNHTHSVPGGGGSVAIKNGDGHATAVADDGTGQTTGNGGSHGHTASSADAGGHTPAIQNHVGVNQPACTRVNLVIKT